jgi:hypothetical protein
MLKNFKNLIPRTFNIKNGLPLYSALNSNFHSSQSLNRKPGIAETIQVLEDKLTKISQLVQHRNIDSKPIL